MSAFIVDLPRAAVHIFGFPLYWYGVLFSSGLLASLLWFKKVAQAGPLCLTRADIESLAVWLVLGTVAGGRLGEMLLYRPTEFLAAPWIALDVRAGGMSSHGGMAGVLAASALYAAKRRIPLLPLLDALALCSTVGLTFGRLGNFVNAEMMGAVSSAPWAIVRPAVDMLPRHPVQLYQAIAEGPVLALVLLVVQRLWPAPGATAAAFAIGYAVLRVVTEAYREVDVATLGLHFGMTNGQLYSVCLATMGVGLLILAIRKSRVPTATPTNSDKTCAPLKQFSR